MRAWVCHSYNSLSACGCRFVFCSRSAPWIPAFLMKSGYKSGYVNPVPKPSDFISAMLWGIANADTRVHGDEKAQIELRIPHSPAAWTAVTLNDDSGNVRGRLCRRLPWFGNDAHDPIPLARSKDHGVILRVGTRPDCVWHLWAASPRAALAPGHFEGCRVKARVRISKGAVLQMGMDYRRNPTIGFGSAGNNHEAGASNWYFPSEDQQEAIFTDINP